MFFDAQLGASKDEKKEKSLSLFFPFSFLDESRDRRENFLLLFSSSSFFQFRARWRAALVSLAPLEGEFESVRDATKKREVKQDRLFFSFLFFLGGFFSVHLVLLCFLSVSLIQNKQVFPDVD